MPYSICFGYPFHRSQAASHGLVKCVHATKKKKRSLDRVKVASRVSPYNQVNFSHEFEEKNMLQ
jgi:hypothetical protein